MENETTGVERKIIGAAIECIEEFGVAGTTIRRIAERAGVNSAAISYYFRGKDALIEKAMETGLRNAFDWKDFADSPEMTARDRLAAVADLLVQGALQYPGMSRAEFHEVVAYGNYDTPAVGKLNDFMRQLEADLRARGLTGNDREIRMAMVQVFSATMLFAGIMPRVFEDYAGFSLHDPGTRREFVERLVDRLL